MGRDIKLALDTTHKIIFPGFPSAFNNVSNSMKALFQYKMKRVYQQEQMQSFQRKDGARHYAVLT